ncbi:MAG: deoxyribonuclease IV [Candidatus Lokiarchaeota archaeon]|nr:deoxyribonuclease IV [Candidatus Lokiarchaeota archaeon]
MDVRLGSHLSVSQGKDQVFNFAKGLGCESVQIFIRSVRSWTSKPLEKKEIEAFISEKKKFKNDVYPTLSHNSYLINLATTDKDKLKKSYDAMTDELTKANQLKLDYVVMHPGVVPSAEKNLTIKDALSNIANQLNNLFSDFKNSPVMVLLETTAGQGTGLGSKFEHLQAIIEEVSKKEKIGICFDTSHVFAAGYNFTNKSNYDAMWNEFEDKIGMKYLHAFHLNDSESKLGSKVDRHAHIGQGEIGLKSFELLLNDKRFEKLPGILETPKSKTYEEDIMNLKTLRDLLK